METVALWCDQNIVKKNKKIKTYQCRQQNDGSLLFLNKNKALKMLNKKTRKDGVM